MAHEVDPEHIERYADLLVNFALGGGDGIARGDVVQIIAPESAKPLYAELHRAVWRAGGHAIGRYRPDDDAVTNLDRDFYATADDAQLQFLPGRYYRGLIDEMDHFIYIEADADPHALADADPTKLMAHQRARRPVGEWQQAKEDAGDLSWTYALYGTAAMAAEARMSEAEYWEQIISACYLDESDPKAAWREVVATIQEIIATLDALPIERLHVRGADADLWITLGERRCWVGGGGRNIPSFEIFTSPDWRGTEGWIRFSEPLYMHGNLLTGIELTFADGVVTRATARENEPLLTEMIAVSGADRVGEFSLTDARLSRITRFMATTLYDENVGGPHGNTHLALGKAIRAGFDGDPAAMSEADWERLGFSDSVIHTDIVSTTDREVTAVLRDGTERVIYAGGRFQLD